MELLCNILLQDFAQLNFKPACSRNFLRWGWWNTGTGCPERWWMPHPWKHSSSGWMGLWATWSSGGCPCWLQDL